jgi:hypothetical protein
VPHWPEVESYDDRYKSHTLYNAKSKVFGSFEDEYADMNFDRSYFLAKKVYIVYNEAKMATFIKDKQAGLFKGDKGSKLKKQYYSFHFKGVSENAVVVADDFALHNNLSDQELSDLYNGQDSKRISDDPVEIFEKLYTEKKASILTFSLRRVSKNTKKNVKPDQIEVKQNEKCYHIVTSYTYKNLTIADGDVVEK